MHKLRIFDILSIPHSNKIQDTIKMNEQLNQYIKRINKRYKTGISTEHSYRGDLQTLIESIVPDVLATNEPTRINCGAPDFIITKKHIPVGYIEAKDIGKPLDSKDFKEQLDRYKKSLPNLIVTDYLDFWLFIEGKLVSTIQIGIIKNKKLFSVEENYDRFIDIIKNFCTPKGQTITSASKLSKMMAGKARLLSQVIETSLNSDEANKEDSSLKAQLKAFQDVLIHDINAKEFSDIYAQTIAYGMFAARLHDPSLEDFTRQEASELIPKSNPFLRKLFQYIAGYDLDDRIKWIVDALADIFRATNVKEILLDFGKTTQQNDPIIHFYETFLAEYDPKLRKSRGVWYTPEPVVNFIVRAIDDILKKEFVLLQGLADNSKITIELKTDVKDKRSTTGYKKEKVKVHKVQILDPATGTGTFLAEVVKQIYKRFEGQEGIWSNYVDEHLIPRLNGFEILMASYAIAHLKLELLLRETGYKPKKEQRLRVFLSNSLEEHHPDTGTLFANWLSIEANEANYVKRDTPVMVVLGNPPYAVSSSNKGEWIQNLIKDYKKELHEKKLNLDDDYIKFIRYGEYFIEKNGEGILAFISNNSFIDGITHRQMRKHLLETFDKIYILNLHGNANKKETSPDSSIDQNVFDIKQGVSINIFIKNTKLKEKALAHVFHFDFFGTRDKKYNKLLENNISSIKWKKLYYQKPYYFFIPRNYKAQDSYSKGFSINKLFINFNSGIQTKNDDLTISFNKSEIKNVIQKFFDLSVDELKSEFYLNDTSGWTAKKAKEDIISNKGKYYKIYYRPFDIRYIYMTAKSGGFVGRPRLSTMKHFFNENNLGLITVRQQSTFNFQHILISKTLIESGAISLQTKEWGYIFPLYLYPEKSGQQSIEETNERTPNLNRELLTQIAEKIDLVFTNEKENKTGTFAPIDILDYIYAVLHSPLFRITYKEFLKIDFPRVTYPKDQNTFWQLVKLGSELRQIHLLESPKVEQYITNYPKDGGNKVTRRITQKDFEIIDKKAGLGCVWINDEQYFEYVPVIAWEFYIGGYQPAQKWLKDRYGKTLSFDDIFHYQKIIVALTETDRIMKEIDKIEFM